ncbi:hypothetical protein [Pontibacter fetidus]|uniref:Uncharacterized protein n=1 Tax=Pontibacter fetidus TaxID=2700082 RepID=A0A6B2H6U0_9BACT|nr:hypothetical protein [Pontibacter fetidus]NDK56107.1 hypothetical protein [Pontibacter fetidus]
MQRRIIHFFLITTALATVILFYYMDKRVIYKAYENRSALGEITMYLLGLSILLQALTHLVLAVINTIKLIQKKDARYKHRLYCLGLGLGFAGTWFVVMRKLANNGTEDFFWGPLDTGLVFIGICACIVNFLYLKTTHTNKTKAAITKQESVIA